MSRIFDPPCRWAATAGRALQVLGLLAAVSGCWGAAPSSLAARRSEVELRHDAKSLRLALEDLQHHFGSAYPDGPSFLARLAALKPALETGDGSAAAKFDALRQEALLAHPLLRSNQLLVVKRRPARQPGGGPGLDIAMPSNHECNSSLARTGYDNELGIARPFWMAACEISNEQFRQFNSTHDNRYYQKRYPALEPGAPGWVGPDARGVTLNGDRQPVVRVSWDEAMAFCRWLAARTGLRFNLPIEAQWEWACRAGTSTPFSFGARDADFSRWANLADVSFRKGLGKDGKQVTGGLEHLVLEGAALSDVRFNDRAVVTAEVGRFQPNAWGLHDLHGNAAEWTRAPYATLPYHDGDAGNEAQPGSHKVVRGGSFFDLPARARSAFRLAYPNWQRVFNVGFRVVCEDGEIVEAK